MIFELLETLSQQLPPESNIPAQPVQIKIDDDVFCKKVTAYLTGEQLHQLGVQLYRVLLSKQMNKTLREKGRHNKNSGSCSLCEKEFRSLSRHNRRHHQGVS